MNYDDVIKDITQQTMEISKQNQEVVETGKQTDVDNLMNIIALEIQRQGG